MIFSLLTLLHMSVLLLSNYSWGLKQKRRGAESRQGADTEYKIYWCTHSPCRCNIEPLYFYVWLPLWGQLAMKTMMLFGIVRNTAQYFDFEKKNNTGCSVIVIRLDEMEQVNRLYLQLWTLNNSCWAQTISCPQLHVSSGWELDLFLFLVLFTVLGQWRQYRYR